MSEPHVSSYNERFMEAFGKGVDSLSDDKSQLIKDMVDKIHEEVISRIEYYVIDELKSNVDDALRSEAAKVASAMLADALAGDDETIRTLFGFNKHYMTHRWIGDRRPTQWDLIDAIVSRRPELFVNEALAQKDVEIKAQTAEVARLHRRLDEMRNHYEGTEET